jgi:prepilin-type N-terminal cleavage/methylation domain-containing protein
MTDKPSHRAGFTLVEMLLVSAVLSVLAGLLLVTLGPVRKTARVTTCASHLRQIGLAYRMYVADYGQYPPPSAPLLVPYLRDKRLLACPEDTTYIKIGAATSYRFHFLIPPQFLPINHFREMEPGVVLLDCPNHLEQRATVDKLNNTHLAAPAYPYHVVLRAGGQVDRVPVGRIKEFFRPGQHLMLMSIYPGEPGYDQVRN